MRDRNKYIKQLKKAIATPANIPEEGENQKNAPMQLISEDNFKVWIMSDDIFGDNQINVTSILSTTKLSDTIEHFLLGKIYAAMLNEYLDIKYANAIDALNSISINCTKNGIIIYLKGYVLKTLTELLEKINHDVLNFVPEQSRFEVIKAKLTKKYSNDLFIDPDYRITYESQRDFEMGNWSFTDREKAIPEITFQLLQNFVGKNSEALNEINLEAFIYGNIDEQNLVNMQDSIRTSLQKNIDEHIVPHATSTKTNFSPQNVPLVNQIQTKHQDHALLEVYLSEINSDDYLAIAEIRVLAKIIEPQFYRIMRTEKQLGYSVFSGAFYSYDFQAPHGIFFSVQQPETEEMNLWKNWLRPNFDDFTGKHMPEKLRSLTQDELDKIKKSFIDKLNERPKSRDVVYNNVFFEIKNQRYDFTRKQKIANAVNEITLESLAKRYHSLVQSDNRRIYGTNVQHIAMTAWDQPRST